MKAEHVAARRALEAEQRGERERLEADQQAEENQAADTVTPAP